MTARAGVLAEMAATLRLALPLMSAQLTLKGMLLVEMALAGRASDATLSAVSVGDALTFAILCPAMGVSIAIEPVIAQAVGAGNTAQESSALDAGVLLALLTALPTMAIAFASTFLLTRIGVDPAVVPEARGFVVGSLPGMAAWLLFLAGKADLEAHGRTGALVLGGLAANVVNVVAGAWLILGDRALVAVSLPPLGLVSRGAFGAGLATSICNALLAAVVLGIAWRGRPSVPVATRVREAARAAGTLLRVGIPAGLQMLAEVGAFSAASVLVARLGAAVSSAHQIALGLSNLTYMAMLGVGSATSVRVGYAVGAGDAPAARRAGLTGIAMGAVAMVACGACFLRFDSTLVEIFTTDPIVVFTSLPLVHIVAAYQVVDAIQIVAGGALRGAADTRYAWLATLFGHWAVGLPLGLALAFAFGRGVQGIWIGLATGLLVVAGATLRRFLQISSRPIVAV